MKKPKYIIAMLLIAVVSLSLNFNKVSATIGQWSSNGASMYYNDGNIGIGNSSPTEKLDVSGNVKVNGIIYLGPYFNTKNVIVSSSWDSGNIRIGSNKHITAELGDDAGVSRFRVTATGQNPGEVFTVNSQGNTYIKGTLNSTGTVTVGTSALTVAEILKINGDVVITRNDGTQLKIQTPSSDVRLDTNGKPLLIPVGVVGIGTYTPNPNYKLSVKGKIRAEGIVVDTGWADFVFEDDYQLMPLSEVEKFIEQNGHLPNVPSAKEVQENGVSIGDSQTILLQKIEELTLYTIELNERVEQLEQENNMLRAQ